MEENKLAVIVKESGLENTKAQCMLDTFEDYFKIAAEWEAKMKTFEVTDESQKIEMSMAKQGRLFLKEKRVAIEKARKSLKEQALREGKAIDGIANVLKALIVPIEEYLGKQEKFVEIREAEAAAKEAEEERVEKERLEEIGRVAEEKAKREEDERIRAENEKLRQEAKVREKKAASERAKHVAEIKAAKEKAEEEAIKRKTEAYIKIGEERKAREAAEAKLAAQVECPECHHKFVPNDG